MVKGLHGSTPIIADWKRGIVLMLGAHSNGQMLLIFETQALHLFINDDRSKHMSLYKVDFIDSRDGYPNQKLIEAESVEDIICYMTELGHTNVVINIASCP